MKRPLARLLKRLLILTLILAIPAGAAGAYWWARQSLPMLSGQLAFSGLGAPVEVLQDRYGVPSVYARDVEDVWFAAGVLHARDRLWQMELYRRVTMGRLSEVLGAETIDVDRRFLTLGLRDAARAEWERAPQSVRTALERYAAGVNAYTATLVERKKRPLEFQILGFMPAAWEPLDSLAIGRLLAWRLAENHQAELVRAAVAAKFDADTALLFTGRYPATGPAIIEGPRPPALPAETITLPPTNSTPPAMAALGPEALAKGAVLPKSLPAGRERLPKGLEWLSASGRRANSNSWVLANRRTKASRPILANDPHLQIEFPAVWYEMHLVAADFDVAGVTIPGIPVVVLGHNARIAWGMTNTGADVQDLVLERVDVAGKRSFIRGQWAPVDVVKADIPVRGGSVVPFEVWKTQNGPIVAEPGLNWDAPPSWLSPSDRQGGERRAYSLRWDVGGDLAAAFEALNRATDWATFTAAVSMFSVPSTNVHYADVDGNIGYAMSGRLPVRAGSDGRMPLDGATAAAWSGTVDPLKLPSVLNPDAGYIASSNNPVDRGFAPLVTNDWTAPFRAMRLKDQLSKAEGADLDTMAALQNDRYSVAAGVLLAGVESAIAKGRAANETLRAGDRLAELNRWDRIVDSRPIVSFFQAFEDAVWRRTFEDEMETELFNVFYEWAGAEKPAGIYALLDDPQSKWWDDILTIEKKETRDDVFLTAAEDAEIYLQNEWGGESSRAWDRIHTARFPHALGARLAFRWLFNRGPVPVQGDGTTVMRISFNRPTKYDAWEYPSWRQLFDVGQWDDSRVVLPSGQSGHPMSPNYFDQADMWRQGEYRRQPFSRDAVSAGTVNRLLLVP